MMNLFEKTRHIKGSVLIFSLIILSFMLISALSIAAVSVSEKKSSFSTEKSSRSFQVADSGVEIILQKIYKGNYATLEDLADSFSGSVDCNANGEIGTTINSSSYNISFYDNSGTKLTGAICSATDWRDQVVKLKSEGVSGNTTRAVEVAVDPCIGNRIDYPTGNRPLSSVFDPVTESVWVANYNDDTVSKISINSNPSDPIPAYSAGNGPIGIAFDPKTESVWVADKDSGYVTQISVSDGSITNSYSVGSNPDDVAYDSKTESVWVVRNVSSDNVKKISVNSGSIDNYSAGNGPRGIVFDPVTESVWIANLSSDSVTKMSVTDGSIAGTYTAGISDPDDPSYDADTQSVWVSNTGNDTIIKIPVNGGPTSTHSVGDNPTGSISDSSNSVWVANNAADTVSKVNANTGVKTDYQTLAAPDKPAFDSVTESIWVPSANDDMISRFCSK